MDSFKQQMVDVIRYAKEHPDSLNQLAAGGTVEDDTGMIAHGLSDVVDVDGATHTSVSVDVTRIGTTQPIPITLSVAAAPHDGVACHNTDSTSQQTAGMPHVFALGYSPKSASPLCHSEAKKQFFNSRSHPPIHIFSLHSEMVLLFSE